MSAKDVAELRRQIVLVCRRLWERGLIAGQDGNVSVRVGASGVLVTPKGRSKMDLGPADLIELRLDGRPAGRRGGEASSEVLMHLAAYRVRPDVRAVVHAHPVTATGFAVAGEALGYAALAEMVYNVGRVPLVPYATPGSPALAERVASFLERHDAVLLANHGAVTVGPTLNVAHQRMESLEHAARILLAAKLVGRTQRLDADDVRALEIAREGARARTAAAAAALRRRGAGERRR